MMNILRIFKGDFKKIRRNTIAWVVILGLMVVPCLYAWFNINASWDPYGKTSQLKIALASKDEGYDGDLLPIKVNFGDSLLNQVTRSDSFDWVLTTEEKAIDGTKSGKYYAAVVVPETFSDDMMSIFSTSAHHSELVYYSNEKENAIASMITDKGASGIQTEIDRVFTGEIVNIAYGTLQSLTDEGNLESVTQGLSRTADQLRNVQSTVGACRSTVSAMSDSIETMYALLDTAEDFAASTKDITSDARDLGQDIDKDIESISKDIDKINGELDKLLELINGLEVGDYSQLIARINGTKSNLTELKTGLQATKAGTDECLDNLDQVADNLLVIADNSRRSLSKLQKALDKTVKALDSNYNEIGGLATEIDKAVETQDLSQLKKFLSQDKETLSQFMASPVGLNKVSVFKVENYGSAMTPFYTSLALWVGAVILVALLKVDVSENRRRKLRNLHEHEAYLGRYLLFLLIGIVQMLLTCLGDLYFLGIQCVHPLLFLVAGLVTSIVFTNLIYTLVVSFGDIGKAIAVIAMVIQVAGSGGTFPVEMAGGIFQKLYPIMPFNYSMTAMREAIAGTYGDTFVRSLLILSIYLVASLVLGLVLRRPIMRLNKMFHHKLEDTGLM